MIREIELEKTKHLRIESDGNWIKIRYRSHLLFDDLASEGLTILIRMLRKAIEGQLVLKDELKVNGVGYWWNEYTELDENSIDIASMYWLWSTRYVQTWLYTEDDIVNIEVSPSYPWHFQEPEITEKFFEYGEFISSFEVIENFRFSHNEIHRIIYELEVLEDEI